MADSVYRVTEVIGVSSESWEGGRTQRGDDGREYRARPACRRGRTSGRDDPDGGIVSYRVRLAISFKYESGD